MDPQDTNGAVADAAAGTESVETSAPQQDSTPGINPAWNDLLETMPSSLHGQMIPHLQKWDQGVQQRFQQVQSQYAPYEPYRDFVDNQVDPSLIQASLQLAQLIESDPRSFYDKMGEYYGKEWGLDQGHEVENSDDYSLDGYEEQQPARLEDNPYLQKIQEQQDTIASVLAIQLQQQQQAQQEQIQQEMETKIDTDLASIAEKYGELSPALTKMIISTAVSSPDQDLMAAADFVFSTVGQSSKPTAPRIMSPGGGVPQSSADVTNLDRKGTRELVVEMLRAGREGI